MGEGLSNNNKNKKQMRISDMRSVPGPQELLHNKRFVDLFLVTT